MAAFYSNYCLIRNIGVHGNTVNFRWGLVTKIPGIFGGPWISKQSLMADCTVGSYFVPNQSRTDWDWTCIANNSENQWAGCDSFLSNTICMKPDCSFSLSFFSKHQRWMTAWGALFFRSFFLFLCGSDNPEAVWKMNKTHFHWERVSSENHRCGIFTLTCLVHIDSAWIKERRLLYKAHRKI